VAEGRYLTHRPIQVEALLATLGDPGLGGTALFLGTVRRSDEDGQVAAIEYSAYDEMATAQFDRIVAETRERWPGVRLAACHRLGSIPTGEASILVAAAMPHRADAFAACRYLVEEVKRRVPIWKREILEDGTKRWRENRVGEGGEAAKGAETTERAGAGEDAGGMG
jgi:molybdopterin synthase catalytic subunit